MSEKDPSIPELFRQLDEAIDQLEEAKWRIEKMDATGEEPRRPKKKWKKKLKDLG